MIKLVTTLTLIAGILGCTSLNAHRAPAVSPPFSPVEANSLFAKRDVLEVELEAPLATLISQRSLGFPKYKEAFVNGKLSYIDEQKQKIEIPVEIHIKGFSTSQFCPIPKFEFKIKSQDRKETLFASLKTVDFNTHCGEKSDPIVNDAFKTSFYNHREALIYQMAELLEIPTFVARPALVKYKNTQIANLDESPELHRAFFLEDMASFRKRLNVQEIKGVISIPSPKPTQNIFSDVKNSPQIDPEDVARIALFESMIGNGDWFIKAHPQASRSVDDKVNLWNVKVVEFTNGKWVPFPHDFNFANIMRGYPSQPLQNELIELVDSPTQLKLKQKFIDKKEALYSLVDTLKNDPEGIVLMKQTLNYFYKYIVRDSGK